MYPSVATITELRKRLSQIQSQIDHLQNDVAQAELGLPLKPVCYPTHPASITVEQGSLMGIGERTPKGTALGSVPKGTLDITKFAKAVDHLCSGIVD